MDVLDRILIITVTAVAVADAAIQFKGVVGQEGLHLVDAHGHTQTETSLGVGGDEVTLAVQLHLVVYLEHDARRGHGTTCIVHETTHAEETLITEVHLVGTLVSRYHALGSGCPLCACSEVVGTKHGGEGVEGFGTRIRQTRDNIGSISIGHALVGQLTLFGDLGVIDHVGLGVAHKHTIVHIVHVVGIMSQIVELAIDTVVETPVCQHAVLATMQVAVKVTFHLSAAQSLLP